MFYALTAYVKNGNFSGFSYSLGVESPSIGSKFESYYEDPSH